MGGMSANIPIKNDKAANDKVNDKVTADKLREVTAGHDGTWVAHPGLIPVAMKVFDEHMKGPNQVRLPSGCNRATLISSTTFGGTMSRLPTSRSRTRACQARSPSRVYGITFLRESPQFGIRDHS
jgi:hypothetical protein